MAQRLNYPYFAKFESDVDNRDFTIVSGIVEGIIKAFNNKEKVATIFEVTFDNGDKEFVLTMKRKTWYESLKKCLPDYEKKELYEKCAEIMNIMNKL